MSIVKSLVERAALSAATLGFIACSDSASAPPVAPESQVRLRSDVSRPGDVVDAAVDLAAAQDLASPVDVAVVDPGLADQPAPDASALGACAARLGATIFEGDTTTVTVEGDEALLLSAAHGTAYRLRLRDAQGSPVTGRVSLSQGPERATLILHPAGHLAAVLVAPYETRAFRVDGQAQLALGFDAVSEVVLDARPPDCLEGLNLIDVEATLGLGIVAQADLSTTAGLRAACHTHEAMAASACAVLEAAGLGFSEPLPAILRGSTHARDFGAAGPSRLEGPASRDLRAVSCGDRLGLSLLAYLPTDALGQTVHAERLSSIRARTGTLLRRLDVERPAQLEVAQARLSRLLVALSRVAALLHPSSYEVLESDASLGQNSGLVRAAASTRALFNDVRPSLDLPLPYRSFVLTGPVPRLDSFAVASTTATAATLGFGPHLDCALPRVTSLDSFADGLQFDTALTIDALLDVLDSAADGALHDLWNVAEPDAMAAADAGASDAALAQDLAVDAFLEADGPIAGPCMADHLEPNNDWQTAVQDGRRLVNTFAVQGLTLMPGDEDHISFERPNGFMGANVGATVRSSNHCEGPSGRVCVELSWWTWVYAEGLLGDVPDLLAGPVCGDLAAGITVPAARYGGLAGEAWLSFVVRVYREGGAPVALPYEITVPH